MFVRKASKIYQNKIEVYFPKGTNKYSVISIVFYTVEDQTSS